GRELIDVVHRVEHIVDVEEPVALQADVDEGRLHAGKELRDPAFVDVADDPALPLAFDEHFGHEVVLENGHDGFVAIGGDDHLLVHFHELPGAACGPRWPGRDSRFRALTNHNGHNAHKEDPWSSSGSSWSLWFTFEGLRHPDQS